MWTDAIDRREWLKHAAGAVAAAAAGTRWLPGLAAVEDPLAPRPPHFAPRANRVIFLYSSGGVSHVDTFDPKPRLRIDDGKPIGKNGYWRASRWGFRPHGEARIEISDLFPELSQCIDDIALIRSMHTDLDNHSQAVRMLHAGSTNFARPSLGSWVSYALGTTNLNLPPFVVLAPNIPYAGSLVWSADFLPQAHQGVRVSSPFEPIPHVRPRVPSQKLQQMEIELLGQMNADHAAGRRGDDDLTARTRSFQTAFSMQFTGPEAFHLPSESDTTLEMYGLERGQPLGFGWQCLAARRLVERGVRFVEVIDYGSSKNWDDHTDISDHERKAREIDRPIAGLLRDLRSRGMLDDTLVVWATEFGRTPWGKTPDHKGRDHHGQAFSCWLAGGGVRGGTVHGVTDAHGMKVVQDPVHVHDLHATILHLLGLDHTRLTYHRAGRDFRLTDVYGRVVEGVLER